MNADQHSLDTARRSASLVEQQRALDRQRRVAAEERVRSMTCSRCLNGEHGKFRCVRPWSCACEECGE